MNKLQLTADEHASITRLQEAYHPETLKAAAEELQTVITGSIENGISDEYWVLADMRKVIEGAIYFPSMELGDHYPFDDADTGNATDDGEPIERHEYRTEDLEDMPF